MKKEFIGLAPIKVEGSNFETGFGISKFTNVKLNGKQYTPVLGAIMNTFGVKDHTDLVKDKIFCKIEEKAKFLEFYSRSGNITCPRWIAGAPTLRLGNGLWSPSSNFNIGKVKDYKKLETSIKFKSKPIKGSFDFAYDIWFTKNKEQKNNSAKDDLEIMIILDNNFKFPWKLIEENEDFIILYENKNQNKLARDKGHCIAFMLKNKQKTFDILKLVEYCSKYLKINFSNYSIKSLDLINEFAANSEAKIELYELNMDFAKK